MGCQKGASSAPAGERNEVLGPEAVDARPRAAASAAAALASGTATAVSALSLAARKPKAVSSVLGSQFSKRTYSLRKRRSTVPTEPLRCLASMNSALPRMSLPFSSVELWA